MAPNEISGTSIEVRSTDQIQIWDSTLWQAMGGLRSSLIGEVPFFGRARFQDAGHVKICELASSPVCVVQDKCSAANEDMEFIKIALQLSGRSLFTQANHLLGFNNLAHFSRSFRHYFGCTLRTYRQNKHNEYLH